MQADTWEVENGRNMDNAALRELLRQGYEDNHLMTPNGDLEKIRHVVRTRSKGS